MQDPVVREFLLAFWKIHILHHAAEQGVYGQWMLEELHRHGYRLSPEPLGPFIMRFDAGTVPVGYLVFSSDSRSLGEIQDLALNRVRPQFATLPGLTSPPPFGGSQRTIVIRVDPDRLRSYG